MSTKIDNLNSKKDTADACVDKANDAARQKDKQCADGLTTKKDAKAESKRLDKQISKAEDRQKSLQGDIAPAALGVSLGMTLVMLLYLVPSSLRTGRTLGKHLFRSSGDPDRRLTAHVAACDRAVRGAAPRRAVPRLAVRALVTDRVHARALRRAHLATERELPGAARPVRAHHRRRRLTPRADRRLPLGEAASVGSSPHLFADCTPGRLA